MGRLRSASQLLAMELVLCFGLGITNGIVWARITAIEGLPDWHRQIISGNAPSPNQYRVLIPLLAEGLRRVLPSPPICYERFWGEPARALGSVYEAYFMLRVLVTIAVLCSFYHYLLTWFSRGTAMGGTAMLAATLPFTYLPCLQESDGLNLLIFVLAFWALAAGKDRWLLPLVFLGTLNRETTAMIPAIYLVVRWGEQPTRKVLAGALLLGLAWALPFALLRQVCGYRAYFCDVIMITWNVGSPVATVHLVLLFGALWLLALKAQERGPRVLARPMWLLLPYLGLHYLVARVYETRLFLPWAPAVIPLAWWRLFPESTRRLESKT